MFDNFALFIFVSCCVPQMLVVMTVGAYHRFTGSTRRPFQTSKSICITHRLLNEFFTETLAISIATRCGFPTKCSTISSPNGLQSQYSESTRKLYTLLNTCLAETLAISIATRYDFPCQLLNNFFAERSSIPIATLCGFPTNCATNSSQKRLGFQNFKSIRFRSQIVSKCITETIAISHFQIHTFSPPMV